MTPSDIATVLAKAAAYDQRTVGKADIAAWHEILHPYELADALQAITRHYTETRERIYPNNVITHIRAIRAAQNRGTSQPLALPGKYEDDHNRNQRLRRGIAACRDAIQPTLDRRIKSDSPEEQTPSERIHHQARIRASQDRRTPSPEVEQP